MELKKPPQCKIKHLTSEDEALAREIVYQAIFTPEGHPTPTRDILKHPELQKYYRHWGRAGDYGLQLRDKSSGKFAGGAFIRYHSQEQPGYGFVAQNIPELSIALLSDYRGYGLGTFVLQTLISELKERNCPGISLSVDAKNPAFQLYKRLGFRTIRQEGNPTMLLSLVSEPFR